MSAAPFLDLETSTRRREDDRGYLEVLYEQGNTVLKRSFSRAGVFRGLHAQIAPSLQTKLIRVVHGKIVDLVVPLDDPDLPIHSREISPDDGWIQIAAHLAHGFLAIEDTLFEYICDGAYDEAHEIALSVEDYLVQTLGVVTPVLSDKDRRARPISKARELGVFVKDQES
jgi:dTDP-4-dehydrorhamnose 3,5-epimerase